MECRFFLKAQLIFYLKFVVPGYFYDIAIPNKNCLCQKVFHIFLPAQGLGLVYLPKAFWEFCRLSKRKCQLNLQHVFPKVLRQCGACNNILPNAPWSPVAPNFYIQLHFWQAKSCGSFLRLYWRVCPDVLLAPHKLHIQLWVSC